MKTLFLIAITLSFFAFSCGNKDANVKTDKNETTKTTLNADGSFPVAYVRMDSLFKKYAFYNELKQLLEQKQKSSETTLNSKSMELEKRAADFQYKMEKQLITSRQAEATQKELLEEQQRLMQMRDQMTQKLMQDEGELNKQLYDSISSYLKFYTVEKKYKLILPYALGSTVLYAADEMDITEEIIKGLNDRYLKSDKK